MGHPHEKEQHTDEQFRTEVRDDVAQEAGAVYYGLGGGGFVLWVVIVYIVVAALKELISALLIPKHEKWERAAIQMTALLVGPLTAPFGFVLWRLFDDTPPDALTFLTIGFLASGAAMASHYVWNDTPFETFLAKLVWNIMDFASMKITGKPLGTIKGAPVTEESMAIHAKKRRRTMSHPAVEGPKDE